MCTRPLDRWTAPGGWRFAQVGLLTVAMLLVAGPGREVAWAVTPNSPEVKELVADGLDFLKSYTDKRLGGKCLVGLAFLKAGQPHHPRVAEAVEACRAWKGGDRKIDVYSNGLAVIFLCEAGPERFGEEIRWYLNLLESRQKSHGGWGYDGQNDDGSLRPTGDTSQTQYAALGYWEAHRRGFQIDPASLDAAADWLVRTQDPDGCWGYQGRVAPGSYLLQQSETNCSMLAAGMGSVLICADLFDSIPEASIDSQWTIEQKPVDVPSALRPLNAEKGPAPKLKPTRVDAMTLLETVERGQKWMSENYKPYIGRKTYYYLYALERYKSFEEVFTGIQEEEPKWYNDGYALLKERQEDDGSWRGYCGPAVDTAFATLFLMRSTQMSLRGRLGEGTLIAGRGLPANVAQAKMRRGQVVAEQVYSKVDDLLTMLDDMDDARLEELARDPSLLSVDDVDANSARRLQQLVRGGQPRARLLAVRALARSGNLDYVPTLIYALSDPDPAVVIEARNGLRFLSRRFAGFGLPDRFTEQQRFDAIESWKNWYRALRPDAVLPP